MQTAFFVLKWGSKIHSYGYLKSCKKEVFSMKKTLTRVLSLVLVLAMFVSAVPLALADETEPVAIESIELSAPAGSPAIDNVHVIPMGGTAQIGCEITPETATEEIVWTSRNEEIATVSNGSVTPHAPGSVIINASSKSGAKYANIIFLVRYIPVLTSNSTNVSVGATVDLPTVTVPGLVSGDYKVSWTGADDKITVSEDNEVTGVSVGEVVLTATITPVKEGVSAGDFYMPELTCTVTVSEKQATVLTPELSADEIEMYWGDKLSLPTISGMGELDEGANKDYTVTWISSKPDIVTIDAENRKFEAVGTGEATLTATIKLLTDDAVFAEEATEIELTYVVTVISGITMEVTESIAMTKGESYTLPAPTFKGEGSDNLNLSSYTYTYTRVSGEDAENTYLNVVSGKQVLTGRSTGRDAFILTVEVTDKTSGAVVEVPPITVYASVYAEAEDITVVLKDNVKSFIFTEEGVMTSMKLGSTEVLSTYKSLAALLLNMNVDHTTDRHPDELNYRLQFSSITADGGSLSDADGLQNVLQKPVSMKYLKRYKFTKDENKLAKSKFEYVVYDDEQLPIMTGTLYIDYAGTSQITYTTDFETSVTFKEEDFERFWAEYGTDKKLAYVTFNSFPTATYGTLYTDTYETTKVTKNMKFIADYYGTSAFYDLDTVTFTPVLRSSAYTISIPFTAVDASNGTVNGTVSINVSKGSKLTITNLGLRLGQAGATLDDVIAADFKKANDDEVLDYLYFVLPEVEEGRLVYDFNRNYDTLLTAEDVLATDKLYYNPGSSENVLDLAEVWFFPAAGASGNIKLSYVAVGEAGTTYEGFITLNVSVKSKSQYFTDVKSGSYSWAADAVDFLRYHGVVNGTNADNTTFSPANSITRAHFMLMLYRAFLADEYSDFNVTSNFPDIPKGTDSYSKELYQAVGVAKYLGITTGSDGKYLPNKNISREEAMTLIYRTLNILDLDLKYTSSNRTGNFSDYNKVSAYAKDPLKYLIEHGVVLGSDGKINPKSNITRAEMAVILHRVLTY